MSDFSSPILGSAAEELVRVLRQRQETVCVAETAAGGMISAALLSIPGASQIFKGAVNLYSLESRLCYGGWTQDDAENYAGPTIPGVLGLAQHVHRTLQATYCIGEVSELLFILTYAI